MMKCEKLTTKIINVIHYIRGFIFQNTNVFRVVGKISKKIYSFVIPPNFQTALKKKSRIKEHNWIVHMFNY